MPDRLILMRHAKSDYPPGVADHDRPLTPRGRRDADAARQWLAEHRADLVAGSLEVLVSSAERAQQTWRIAGDGFASTYTTEPRIYDAAVSSLIDLAAASSADTVVIVGHNPTIADCLAHLIGEHRRVRTCTIAALALAPADPWSSGSATVIEFAVPRAFG